ncbi:MAG: SurA N-terminal domain-containing protein [Desulfobacterales bacterium]|nr:SurA N-terminal domain-containing protein [Desulfobacterales bacterium]
MTKNNLLLSAFWALFHLAFYGLLFAIPAWAQTAAIVDRIVAVVNDEIITLYELNKTMQPYEENIEALDYTPEKKREMLFKLRTDLLNKLIDQKLADQQIKKNNIKVSTKEIDMAIERIKEMRAYTEEDLRAGLAQQGLTMEEYRENLKQQLLRSNLVNREIKSKIVITNGEIEEYYNSHREKYAGQTKYHLWNIAIRFSSYADSSEVQSALEKMQAVLRQLKQGRSFVAIVKESGRTPGMPEGADLGLYELDELSPDLQRVVKDMKAGEFSPILSSPDGHQIIYIEETLNADPKAISEAKNEIQEILYNEAINNRYEAWLSELRKRSHIKIIK